MKVIRKSDFGDRFIVAFDTIRPYLSAILVDYPVPDDIQKAPENAWKDVPDWNKEREAGNTGTLWDRSKAEKPVLKRDITTAWVICGIMLFLLLITLRDIIEFFEELPGNLKKLPSYFKNTFPGLLAKWIKFALAEINDTFRELKNAIINLPDTLKKLWRGEN